MKEIVKALLEINAIKLSHKEPFTWASGWKSPIYCDNRKTLSYPNVRQLLKDSFCGIIREKYPEAEVIAGVATGAIAIGALVADELGLPFIYVRSAPKGHGLENLIEGVINSEEKVVIIEDLISTGGSSLKATEALRASGAEVLGMCAIFSYLFPISTKSFHTYDIELSVLSNYNELIELALEKGIVKNEDVDNLKKWREAPDKWGVQGV
ncbi:MAG: orotate phosphoribosyltransferase [Bacteroidales bacterium]